MLEFISVIMVRNPGKQHLTILNTAVYNHNHEAL